MADQKLTQLPPLPTDPQAGDKFYVVRDDVSYQMSFDQFPATTVDWGQIGGVLANQTDLVLALDAKVEQGDITGSGLTMSGPGLLGADTGGPSSIGVVTIGAGLDLTAGVLTATAAAPAWGEITGTLADQTDLQAALDAKQATGNYITALTGDVTATGPGSVAATVVRINGQSLAALGTGILKNTTGTGVPSIAVAGDFPTLNQNTTGSAATLTTSRNINGVAFNGSADITITVPVATGITGLGTGIATALAVNVGSAGAPVLFDGALGTPSSGTLTNATGLPISTGVSGLGSNVAAFLATPSSANLRSALTDETGTGAAVFADGPAFTTSLTLDGVDITPEIRQNVQTGSYTMVLSDANKHIYTTTGTTATWTIPANSSVAFKIGTTLVFVMDATGTRTIAITTDTLEWAPSGATGSRTLTGIGVATALKVSSTKWIISGTGLT